MMRGGGVGHSTEPRTGRMAECLAWKGTKGCQPGSEGRRRLLRSGPGLLAMRLEDGGELAAGIMGGNALHCHGLERGGRDAQFDRLLSYYERMGDGMCPGRA